MAIDDNTTYGLTGAQIKELPGKINAGVEAKVKTNTGAPTTSTVGTVGQLLEDTTNGKLYQCTAVDTTTDPSNPSYTWEEVGGGSGIIKLTSADYNYPTNNPNCVALWLLDSGTYVSADSTVMTKKHSSDTSRALLATAFVDSRDYTGQGLHIRYATIAFPTVDPIEIYYTADGSLVSGFPHYYLHRGNIVNALNNTSTERPLSAYQGYILNYLIGDLSTLTTTAKTSTVAAINELNSMIGDIETALNAINNGGNAQ